MTLSRFSLVVIAFFVALSAAKAQMTALQLQALCTSPYNVDVGMCAGYIAAIADNLLLDSDPRAHVCLSPAIGPQTLADNVTRAWAERAPQPQDFAADSVTGVLRERFRCP